MKTLHTTKTYTVYETETFSGKKYIAINFTGYLHTIDIYSLLNAIDSQTKKNQAVIRSVARRFAEMTKDQISQWD